MERIQRTKRAFRRRGGAASRVTVFVLVGLLALPLVAWRLLPGLSSDSSDDLPMLHVVEKGEFVHEITERGSVESASNIEVRCEVQAQNSAGTRILEVVSEGTYVKTGDQICRLDSSALENDQLKQKSVVENANAAKIQAESDHETAKKARDEYLEGKYKIDRAQIDADKDVAEEYARRAADNVRYSKQLLEKGYITSLQLQADVFAARKAETDLEAAKLKLKVLDEYTKAKTKLQLEADIKSTAAKLEAQVNTWQLEVERLKLIETQIVKCKVVAPANGQVVYANNTERYGGNEIIIEEGAVVRERQVIVRLPDPKRMQVKARINESKIAMVKEDQPTEIRLDALPDEELRGIVRKVNEYPVQGGWWAANIKEYETTVEILGSPEGLRPGLNAEVRIRVAHLPSAIQIPVQAVLTQGDKHYCFVRKDNDFELREIEVGNTNDKMIVVKSNLAAGESVAMSAASLREQYELPEVPAPLQDKTMLASTEGAAAPSPKASEKPAVKTAGSKRVAAGGPPPDEKKRRPGESEAGKADPAAMAAQRFQELDKNGDGRLSKDEIPATMQDRVGAADTNRDGFIDRREWLAAAQALAARGPERKPKTRGG
jgi:multidrug resistance efflux pump